MSSAKALITFGADINSFNSANETPADIAAAKCPPLHDLLSSIGGLEGRQIMAELELDDESHSEFYSCAERQEGEEEVDLEGSFERMLDPEVMSMEDNSSKPSKDLGGGDKMADIPEGMCCMFRSYHHLLVELLFM